MTAFKKLFLHLTIYKIMINLSCHKDEKPAQSLLKKRDKDDLVAPIWNYRQLLTDKRRL
jgi:hypothetical protein